MGGTADFHPPLHPLPAQNDSHASPPRPQPPAQGLTLHEWRQLGEPRFFRRVECVGCSSVQVIPEQAHAYTCAVCATTQTPVHRLCGCIVL